MLPFYFGPSGRTLYGVYESAAGGAVGGMVICQPFGAEYFNAHRVARSLTKQLADGGIHTLRFDYLGTGDSARELDGVGAEDWLEDIRLAIQELRDAAGVRLIGLIGVRMGAALALSTSLRSGDVDRLVLWDPVETDGPSDGSPPYVPTCEALLREEAGRPLPRTLLACTGGESRPLPPLAAELASRCDDLAIVREDERGAWESEGGLGSLPVPVRSLKAITDWCLSTW